MLLAHLPLGLACSCALAPALAEWPSAGMRGRARCNQPEPALEPARCLRQYASAPGRTLEPPKPHTPAAVG
eukprot:9611870-Alexandrium_andersonii.AAC.1